MLGLSEHTTSITIVGITLGLTYGGGLLIHEANKGELSKMDVFGSISLLAISHSLIEDTLLIMLLGASLSGILYARIIFSIILITLIIMVLNNSISANLNGFSFILKVINGSNLASILKGILT